MDPDRPSSFLLNYDDQGVPSFETFCVRIDGKNDEKGGNDKNKEEEEEEEEEDIRRMYSDEYYCDSDGHLQRHSDQSGEEEEE